jgi:RHS repeat-associated protein
VPVRKYIYDGDAVLQETDGAGNVLTEYTRTGGGYGDLLSAFDGTNARYFEPDALGSTDALSDQSQAVADRWSYWAFGQANQTSGTNSTPFTWVGREGYLSDSETGLYLLGSGTRYYDPATTQFLSKDPLGTEPSNTNLYCYALNSPSSNIDPFGLYAYPSKGKCDTEFQRTLDKAILTFFGCRQASDYFKLCKAATKGKGIKIKCDDRIKYDSTWDPNTGTIKINPKSRFHPLRDVATLVGLILFETLNACREPESDKLLDKCIKGEMSQEDYVRAQEGLEYDNIAEHHRVIQACLRRSNPPWFDNADLFAGWIGVSREEYFKAQDQGGHSDIFKKFWNDACKAAFLKKAKKQKDKGNC